MILKEKFINKIKIWNMVNVDAFISNRIILFFVNLVQM